MKARLAHVTAWKPECDVPVPGMVSESLSEKSIRTGIGKNWFRKKSRNRYWKNLVPEKSLGTSIGQIWYRKKVSEPVSEKFTYLHLTWWLGARETCVSKTSYFHLGKDKMLKK